LGVEQPNVKISDRGQKMNARSVITVMSLFEEDLYFSDLGNRHVMAHFLMISDILNKGRQQA